MEHVMVMCSSLAKFQCYEGFYMSGARNRDLARAPRRPGPALLYSSYSPSCSDVPYVAF